MRTQIKFRYLDCTSTGIVGLFGSIFLAVIYTYFLLPDQFIKGTSSFWNAQTEDITAYQVGFNAFFREPWQEPFLRISSLNWPEGTLATFVDIIPLYSSLLKLFASQAWFPFNPFGVWIFLCIILQAVASWWILYEAQVRNWSALLVQTLILLSAPCWLNRVSHHTSLFSHWLLLFAFALIVRDQRVQRFSFWPWFFLLLSAFFINIYLFFMASLVATASWLFFFYKQPRVTLFLSPVLVITSLLVIVYLTMFPLPIKSTEVESGFGLYSLNLASPWSGGLLMQINPDAHSLQQRFEGFNYLGLGVIGLVGICLITIFQNRAAKPLRQSANGLLQQSIFPSTLWCLFLIFFLYALSNQIYWGSQLLYEWQVPKWAQEITGQFRVSGRFFWPIGYGLIIFAVIFISRHFSKSSAALVLLFAGFVQLIDVSPLIQSAHQQLSRVTKPVINLEQWRTYVPSHIQTLYVFPKIKCNKNSLFLETQLPVTLFASVYGLNVSTAYIARFSPNCQNETAEILSSDLRASAYIFTNSEYSTNKIQSLLPANARFQCQSISPFTLCIAQLE